MSNRTESANPKHADLDLYSVERLVEVLVDDQMEAFNAVRACSGAIAQAVSAAVPRITSGGRLIYVGAGTSGRLGMLDSVELYPTFSWPRERAVALLAGGPTAMVESVEGAEDNEAHGAADLIAIKPTTNDVLLAIAASGRTPYVLGALRQAKQAGALTIGFANNPDSLVANEADIGVTLDTGAEVIGGSTRLKAGTAQKIALNSFSSALMVRMHKVYGNLMVDMRPSNVKLLRRAVLLTMQATGASEDKALQTLESCAHQVKLAIVCIKKDLDAETAAALLARHAGSVRQALSS